MKLCTLLGLVVLKLLQRYWYVPHVAKDPRTGRLSPVSFRPRLRFGE